MNKFEKAKKITRLILFPFEELDILEATQGDEYKLVIQTFEGKKYEFIFKRRISYSDINEFSLYKIRSVVSGSD